MACVMIVHFSCSWEVKKNGVQIQTLRGRPVMDKNLTNVFVIIELGWLRKRQVLINPRDSIITTRRGVGTVVVAGSYRERVARVVEILILVRGVGSRNLEPRFVQVGNCLEIYHPAPIRQRARAGTFLSTNDICENWNRLRRCWNDKYEKWVGSGWEHCLLHIGFVDGSENCRKWSRGDHSRNKNGY